MSRQVAVRSGVQVPRKPVKEVEVSIQLLDRVDDRLAMASKLTTGEGVVENLAISPANPLQEMDQYRAAMAHSDGDPIEEIEARTVKSGMTLWFTDIEAWVVVAAKLTTGFPSGEPLNGESRRMTFIPVSIGLRGRTSRRWAVPSDSSLIRRLLSRRGVP